MEEQKQEEKEQKEVTSQDVLVAQRKQKLLKLFFSML